MNVTKDQLLGIKLRVEPVEIPGVGTAYVKEMNGADLEAVTAGQADRVSLRSVVAKSLCDESGNRLFADGEVDKLGEIPASVLKALFDKAAALNSLTAATIEAEAKNS